MNRNLIFQFCLIALFAHANGNAQSAATLAEFPEGFAETVVATGLTGATAMAVSPDGRVFVCEQTGTLRVIKNDRLLEQPCLTVPVDSSWERGLIGVTVDPDFPERPFLYVCYVAAEPYPHHRISRFTLNGDVTVVGSEVVLLSGDDQTKLGGGVPNGHQGGAIHFGNDGLLYIAIGEQTAGLPSQNLDTFQGKLLRIDRDGSIPSDNPFFSSARGKYRAIWATGLRNPFAFAIQPGTGRMLINDVGDARWEEINEGVAGANFGWPHAEGPSADKRFQSPLYAYDRSQGKSITGGMFYNPPVNQFPKVYVGKYFFAEFMDNWIRVFDPDHPQDMRTFATKLAGPVDLQFAPDGSVYLLNRNAWVKDEKFKPNTGSLHRIVCVSGSGKPAPLIAVQPAEVTVSPGAKASFRVEAKGQLPLRFQWYRNGHPVAGAENSNLEINVTAADDGAEFRCFVSNEYGLAKSRSADLWTTPWPKMLETLRVRQIPDELPRLLSETGVFASLKGLVPTAGIVPYEVNSSLWSDGAEKRRWMALPKDRKIDFAERGAWKFPAGTVLIKHFELPASDTPTSRRIETRFLVINRRGTGYGVTYRWRADGSDAEILTDGMTEEIDLGDRKQIWSYPSRNDCLVCHTSHAGFVLGVNTRQLNGRATSKSPENVLQTWNRLGLFQPALRDEDLSRLEQLFAVDDTTATLEQRVRSYLDSNCAQCHRPGGTRGEFDARFETPLEQQRLVGGAIISSNLGVGGAKLVVPGDPDRSMIYQRMKRRQDSFNMPPQATHAVDTVAVATVAAWIQSLATDIPDKKPIPPAEITQGRFNKVENLLQGHVDRKQISGAVALVLQRGRPVFSAAVGLADIGEGRPMSQETLFRIASMTKPITSVAVLMLVDEGRINLNDPVSVYLPEYKNLRVLEPNGTDTVPALREVTIHQLLSQTSGLTYGFLAGDRLGTLYREGHVSDGLAPSDHSLDENIRNLARVPLKHQPGTAWDYGLSTDVLGRIVEVVSDKSLDDFFRERIFKPLEMSNTSFSLPQTQRNRLAAVYRPSVEKSLEKIGDQPVHAGPLTYSAEMPFLDPPYCSGGAGLVSTANDYAKFLMMILNHGQLDKRPFIKRETTALLRPESIARMSQNQIGDLSVTIGGHGDKFGYGFGVVTKEDRGNEVSSVGTVSWGGIYNTYFWADPEKEIIGILLTQLFPFDQLSIREDFKRLSYEALAQPLAEKERPNVRVSEESVFGDIDCFKIETPTATYHYGKKGAGFVAIQDKQGNEWIAYRPEGQARGEYRGLPKSGQPTKFFHGGYGYGQYKSNNLFVSRVTIKTPDHVRIESETRDRKSACSWDFYPSHATLTLQKIDESTYWFLYEGTPGGQLNADQDFVIRPDGTKTTLDTPWSQVVPWVCFGANESPFGFVCINHQEPEPAQTDSYVSWPFEKDQNGSFQEMTVFGFGRKGYKELIDHVPDLKRLPAKFSIGFVSAADHAVAKSACEAIRHLSNE